jgi:hypothetical protein
MSRLLRDAQLVVLDRRISDGRLEVGNQAGEQGVNLRRVQHGRLDEQDGRHVGHERPIGFEQALDVIVARACGTSRVLRGIHSHAARSRPHPAAAFGGCSPENTTLTKSVGQTKTESASQKLVADVGGRSRRSTRAA